MEDRIQFDINESLKYYLSDPTSLPTPDADPELVDCEADPDNLSTTLIDNVLNSIVDSIAESPEGLARPSFFDSMQFLLKYSSFLPTKSLSKLLDLIVSGLSVEADIIHGDLESDEQDNIQHHKQLLEMEVGQVQSQPQRWKLGLDSSGPNIYGNYVQGYET
ncbi:hypothetical protein EYZ11_005057 [Aspergillus tanneri]|uniref:Condensin complex subunit 1 N-terminal domain-containing protein n=1 Tax=Aspergillus tanneri TaxID=1220188 RepID=A0A4S3JJ24_9EURO|nr:hypothetical protein EYZ11_005057 [Aspergillus tanneri]